LPGRILGLLGGLSRRILSLLGSLTRCILGTLGCLPGLVGGLPCCVLSLLGSASCGVLGLLGGALGGVLRSLNGLSRLVGHLTGGILSLSGRLAGGVLDALHGLPGLVCHLVQSALVFLALLWTGVGFVAGLLGGFRGLGRRRYLQVEEAAVLPKLQADQRPRLVGNGGRRVALFVGGCLVTFRCRQIGGVAHRTLVYYVALLVEDHFDQVAFLVNGTLDGVTFLIGGGVAERLGTGGEAARYLADLIDRPSRGVLYLVGDLACGVSHLPGDLPDLICNSSQQTSALLVFLVLLALSAFAHLLSSLLEFVLSDLATRIVRVTPVVPLYPAFRPLRGMVYCQAVRRFST
jgi:hypothetical protein